ncbi:MAG: Gfo/Idh/MocA family protein [Planctomycetaceae bacterium]
MPNEMPVRIGLLGTARIAKMALLSPARQHSRVEVAAVASRSEEKARQYAQANRIPRSFASYQALLDDPEIEVIYNPLPNHLHAEWSIKALQAGKHVLCEKPIASNAEEARAMQVAATQSGRQLIEAFHFRYHPLAARLQQIVTSGELGTIQHLEAKFCVFIPGKKKDIRFAYATGGGACMDVGCYAVNVCRFLAGSEPVVASASARLIQPEVDQWMTSELQFPGGVSASVTVSLRSQIWNWRAFVEVTGERGTLTVLNPFLPQFFHRITVQTTAGRRRETVSRQPSSYACQLAALVDSLRGGAVMPTDASDGIKNMTTIDAIYSAAGLRRRGEPLGDS